MPFLPPNQQHQSTEGEAPPQLVYAVHFTACIVMQAICCLKFWNKQNLGWTFSVLHSQFWGTRLAFQVTSSVRDTERKSMDACHCAAVTAQDKWITHFTDKHSSSLTGVFYKLPQPGPEISKEKTLGITKTSFYMPDVFRSPSVKASTQTCTA